MAIVISLLTKIRRAIFFFPLHFAKLHVHPVADNVMDVLNFLWFQLNFI